MSERLQDYNFELPVELIAQKPVEPRDASRLLVVDRRRGTWDHRHFRDLPDYLDSNDLLVANNTKVLKARLLGQRILKPEALSVDALAMERPLPRTALGGKVEFLMLEERGPRKWEGLFHASAKYLPGVKFQIPTPDGLGIIGTIVVGSAESPSGTIVVEFDRDPVLVGAGELPLPKYIRRDPTFVPEPRVDQKTGEKKGAVSSENLMEPSASLAKPIESMGPTDQDERAYQTVYSKELGSAAAPTAGLHFTPELVRKLRAKGVGWEELTLHVGVGTFRPVKTEDIAEHVMHEERYEIKSEVARAISQAKREGRRIVAIGTTSVRTLESAVETAKSAVETAGPNFGLKSGIGRTSIFIRPGHFQFQVVDRLITNFHLPQSTLLMLVSAFAGRELVMAAYQDAVRERYRFFSYGDAMLIV